jgi:hypothetical protein
VKHHLLPPNLSEPRDDAPPTIGIPRDKCINLLNRWRSRGARRGTLPSVVFVDPLDGQQFHC